jgi:hypothetical protein
LGWSGVRSAAPRQPPYLQKYSLRQKALAMTPSKNILPEKKPTSQSMVICAREKKGMISFFYIFSFFKRIKSILIIILIILTGKYIEYN